MAQQMVTAVENNFTGGLKTEFTALNFPENACTDTDNCVFSVLGDVERRAGFDYENAHTTITLDNRTGSAISRYKWKNVAGAGRVRIYVVQLGNILYFYRYSDSSTSVAMSSTKLATSVDLTNFQVSGAPSPQAIECDFTDGNGYLFVFHPSCNPFYVSYNSGSGTVTASVITLQVRDFVGVLDSLAVSTRPSTLSDQHSYNLRNQGWSSSPAWTATSSTVLTIGTGAKVFTVAAGLPITGGTQVTAVGTAAIVGAGPGSANMAGTVTSYAGTTLTLNITSASPVGIAGSAWTIAPFNAGLLNTWNAAEGNYPSNADVWWRFRNNSGVFDPATTQPNITLNSGPANNGFYIINPFDQQRSAISGLPNITNVTTTARPSTGTWFQGRVWYAGVDGYQAATGNAEAYSWNEHIYFSQVVVTPAQFGMCYQNNDPTAEEFFDELPTDGGEIVVQGAGPIHKLVPVQNGLLVFADNGIWFITGSQGIGFAANDYTITKIASIPSLSHSSFVDVMGWPVFWNEDGIYAVSPSPQGGGLTVNNLCLGTIQSFYDAIPSQSKFYVRGDYDPLNYEVRWIYRSTAASDTLGIYTFDRVLTYHTSIKAFYPFSISSNAIPKIIDISYINSPGGVSAPAPVFKYFTAVSTTTYTFSEIKDNVNWKDFHTYDGAGWDYTSYFTTGYKLHGKGVTKFQPIYYQVFFNSDQPSSYQIQGIWDFATSGSSGKVTNSQRVTNATANFGTNFRKHKIRGRGVSLQIKVQSISGQPFNILGWSSTEAINTSM
jgi:hypothetical protein